MNTLNSLLPSLRQKAPSGKMSLRDIEHLLEMTRKEALAQHTAAISQLQSGNLKGYFQTFVYSNGKRKVLRARTMKELEDKIVDFYTSVPESSKHTVKECFEGWIEDLAINKKPSTLHAYEKVFHRHFGGIENSSIEELSVYDIKAFVKKEVAEKQLTAKGYAALKTDLLGIYHYAKDRLDIDVGIDDIVTDLGRQLRGSFQRPQKVLKKDRELIFLDEEIKRVSDYCLESGSLTDLGILLLFKTGLRVGELAALKKSDIVRDCSEITVSRTEERIGSGAEYIVSETPKTEAGIRNVLVTQETTMILREILRRSSTKSEYLFADGELDRYPAKKFRDRLYRLCTILHMPKRGPHAIRRTYASKLYEAGVPEQIIIKQMGHIDFDVTKSFYIFNRKNEEEIISELEKAI